MSAAEPKFLRWRYQDATGKLAFQHYRVADPDHPRGKRYGYRYLHSRVKGWVYGKPEGADELLYKLPYVLENRRRTLWLTEGERDADVLLRRDELASCHHGGAGKFTEAQALSIAGRRAPIVLVADNDPSGARCVLRRLDLLGAAGVPAKRLRVAEVAPPHTGADLRDHFAAGFGFADLRRADLGRLREVAATADPAADGYMVATPQEIADIKTWRPKRINRRRWSG